MTEEMLNSLLATYIGGQMEIQVHASKEIRILRGEIKSIAVKDCELHAEFTWFAEMGSGNTWIRHKNLTYEMNFEFGYANNIGPSPAHIGGDDRLHIGSRKNHDEFAILFPANGSKLDSARIQESQII